MPTTEYAAGAVLDGWKSLAGHTGLPVQKIADLAMAGELRSLFGADRKLLPQIEIRSRFGGTGLDPAKALADLRKKAPGISGRQALDLLQAKRRAWTFS